MLCCNEGYIGVSDNVRPQAGIHFLYNNPEMMSFNKLYQSDGNVKI
ncbi:MAG TPA: hypothetical protein VFA71_09620 [Terriglobales bacterium]|nr:hypothetical protein [Terriglobales bacterium]